MRWIGGHLGGGLLSHDLGVEFVPFYEAHRAEVFGTAFLITLDREEAKDLTQETFARAFEHWHAVSRHERPGAWLQTVVGRLSISWRRRQAARRHVPAREDRVTLNP